MKKRICFILAAVLACSVFAGCGGEPSNVSAPEQQSAQNVPVTEETVPEESDELPDIGYEGATFRIYAQEYLTTDYHMFYDIYEQVGSVVNDASFARNRNVEERFDIHLEYFTGPEREKMTSLYNSIQSGEGTYDLASGFDTATGVSSGMLYDMNKLDHIHLEKSWYRKYVNDEFETLGRQYGVNGCFDMATVSRTACTFFSTVLAENYQLGDFYALVRENEWTFDKMFSFAKATADDLNGDGVMTEADQYGLCGGYNMNSMLIISTGYRFTTKEADGTRKATGLTELVVDFNKMLYDTYQKDWYYNCYKYENKENHFLDVALPNFIENRYLFFLQDVSYTQQFSADMDDYGILPIPKYSASQDVYMSYCRPSITVIPLDVKDPERSAIILEALQHESQSTVLPAYYDIALSHRYASSADASEMLGIIFSNTACDFAQIWYITIGVSPNLHNSIGITDNYASYFAGVEKTFNANLASIMEKIAGN